RCAIYRRYIVVCEWYREHKTDKSLKTPSNLSEAIGYLENLIKSHGNKKYDIKTSPDDNDRKRELQALLCPKEADLKLKAETIRNQMKLKIRDEILKIKAQKYDEILEKKKHDTNPILKKNNIRDIARINNPMANKMLYNVKTCRHHISKDEDVSKDSNQKLPS
ncbi:hypothetical protein DERP_003322, partial [Dermatophagoides pteronyssinus]